MRHPAHVARVPESDYTAVMVFNPIDPERRRRFKTVPVRMLVPNLITLLALCAGLTAIRLAFENKLDLALAAIVFAALLDGVDGRVARLLKGTSRFGAELDSLADFVNFGVAPALILYFWGLHDFKSVGWIAALVFAICGALRLARFNVMIDDPDQPVWAGNFFTGVPAPAGAITVLLPIYLNFLGLERGWTLTAFTFVYVLLVGFLMISRLPVFSGKQFGKRVRPEMVLPIFVLAVLFFALLLAFPFEVLTICTLLYLGALPFGWVSWQTHARAATGDAVTGAAATEETSQPSEAAVESAQPGGMDTQPGADERPARLN
jgi:CDP-diacylglycerol--serine O-phosphatidyltransferase